MDNTRKPDLGGSAPIFKGIRVLLACILVWSDGTGAFAARDLWSDRRRAARAAQAGSSTAHESRWAALAASCPPFEKGVPALPVPAGHDALPDWLESTVGLYADVGEFHPPASGEHRVLIHIQDLHEVEEAQRNTASVLEQLAARLGGKRGLLVGLEGATGGFRTADFRALASPPILLQTASRLLKAGLISGPEFFSLTTPAPFRFWGVEDASAYEANIRALTDTFAFQEKDDVAVSQALANTEKLKAKVYPPGLLELDRLRSQYEQGQIGLGSYVRQLSKGVSPEDLGPNVRVFLEALTQEEDVALSRVSDEQTRLLDKLAPLLSETEAKSLMEAGLAHRMGRIRFSRFYAVLKRVSAAHGLSLENVPGLVAYAEYAAKAEGLNPAGLLRDVDALADRRTQSLLSTPHLAALASVSADVRLLDRLNRFVLTPRDYQILVLRRPHLGAWRERAIACDVGTMSDPWPDLTPLLERHEKFYAQAESRNRPLVQNLTSQWADEAPAILVAGGYHAEGIRSEALALGLGYISLIPRVSSTKEFPPPLASFRSGEPREWVFRGDQAGLHNRLMTANPSPTFLERFFALLFGCQALEAISSQSTLTAALEQRIQWEIKKTMDAARAFGVMVAFKSLSSVNRAPDGSLLVTITFSVDSPTFPAQLKDSTITTTVIVPFDRNPQNADITVRIARPSVLVALLNRLGQFERGEFTRLVVYDLWDRVALLSSKVPYVLGQTTRQAAVVLVKPIRYIGTLLGFSDRIDTLKQNLMLSRDRRYVQFALAAPFALREALLSRLAMTNSAKLNEVWTGVLSDGIQENITHGALPNVSLESPSLSSDGVWLASVKCGDRSERMKIHLSESRALLEIGSLFQITRSEDGAFVVYVQMPVVSGTFDIPKRVLKQIMSEIALQSEGKTPEEARELAFNSVDAKATALALKLREMEDGLNRRSGELANFNGIKLTVPPDIKDRFFSWRRDQGAPPLEFVVRVDQQVSNEVQVGMEPYFGVNLDQSRNSLQPKVLENVGGLTELLEKNLGLSSQEATHTAERIAALYLRGAIAGLEAFSRLEEARPRFFGSFDRDSLLELAMNVLLERLSSVGWQQGFLAALKGSGEDGGEQAALIESVSTQFLSVAQTFLGLLSMRGIHVEGLPQDLQQELVSHMVRIYAAYFQEGYRELQNVSISTEEMDAIPGSVFHLTQSVETSSIVGALIGTLARSSNIPERRFFILMDVKEGGAFNSVEVRAALLARLEREVTDPEALQRATQILNNPNLFVIRDVRDVRQGKKISMARLLGAVRQEWPTLVSVGIFTNNANAFERDEENKELIAWALYENLILVSRSVDVAKDEEAVRALIRQQA